MKVDLSMWDLAMESTDSIIRNKLVEEGQVDFREVVSTFEGACRYAKVSGNSGVPPPPPPSSAARPASTAAPPSTKGPHLEVVSFGKHKGSTFEAAALDTGYVAWCRDRVGTYSTPGLKRFVQYLDHFGYMAI